jgi:hypothetical protein
MIPLLWRHNDRAYVRGQHVRIIAFYFGGGVLVDSEADGRRMLVLRRELRLPLPAPEHCS